MAPLVKSAVRVMAVLEHFAQQTEPATVGEIAEHLGLPQSSTSMLLSTLVSLGYLQFDSALRTYHPTLRVALLSARPGTGMQTLGRFVDGMEELRRRTSGSVMIAMRQGLQARYIAALRGENPVGEDFGIGVLRPVCRVAPGRLLLSHETEATAARIIRRANSEEADPAQRLPVAELLREIAAIRAQGWAESPGHNAATGLVAIGLPPLPGQPRLALALGLPIGEARSRRAEIVADLRAIAALVAEP